MRQALLVELVKDKQEKFETEQQKHDKDHGDNQRPGVAVVDVQLNVDRAQFKLAQHFGRHHPERVGRRVGGKVTVGSAERKRTAV